MTRFYLIRHGLTDTVGKYLSGRSPGIFLNEEGRNQVQKLAQNLTEIPISLIFCSPLDRTLETAHIISKVFNLTPLISEEFQEIDFGKWTNRSIEDLKKDPLFNLFNSFRSGIRIPDGEFILDAQTRIVTGIEKLKRQYTDQNIVIVSHADLIRLAIGYYAGIHVDLLHRIEISPSSYSIIDLFDETVRIVEINRQFS